MRKTFDWFLPGMGVSVLLVWLFPDPGVDSGILGGSLITAKTIYPHDAALADSRRCISFE